LAAIRKKQKHDDEPSDPRKRWVIVRRVTRVAIDVITTCWLLGQNDEVATSGPVTTVIVILKVVRAVL